MFHYFSNTKKKKVKIRWNKIIENMWNFSPPCWHFLPSSQVLYNRQTNRQRHTHGVSSSSISSDNRLFRVEPPRFLWSPRWLLLCRCCRVCWNLPFNDGLGLSRKEDTIQSHPIRLCRPEFRLRLIMLDSFTIDPSFYPQFSCLLFCFCFYK